MAIRSQEEISRRMRDQLRLLDPEVSIEPGTPERKIFDVVAQAIAEVNADLFVQNYVYDIDTKFGQDLDDMLSLFSFDRITAKRATGRVIFTRNTPAPAAVFIPAGTQVIMPGTSVSSEVTFHTVTNAAISIGGTEVEVIIEAVVPGTSGNVPAGFITLIGSNLSNVSGVYNPVATINGTDDESDAEYRLRFKQNVFRNIAGTDDQFRAIPIASKFVTRAHVIGPVSTFSEYLQIDNDGIIESGNPHAKYIYDFNYFLSSDGSETAEFYYPNVDYYFTIEDDVTPVITIPATIFAKPTAAPTVEVGNGGNLNGSFQWAYTYVYDIVIDGDTKSGETQLSPASDIATPANNEMIITVPVGPGGVVSRNIYRLVNGEWRYVGEIANNIDTEFDDDQLSLGKFPPKNSLQTDGVIYFEHQYISKNSRNFINDISSVTNRVDIYFAGKDIQTAKDVIVGPGSENNFVDDDTSAFHYLNYQKIDGSNPSVGDRLLDLIWTPISSIPSQIIAGTTSYSLGTDYHLVRDITNLRNSKRSRDGISLSPTMATAIEDSRIELEYSFNRLPLLINQVVDQHKQITQDVLVHEAVYRYFNVNLVIIYTSGFNKNIVNNQIRTALSNFFDDYGFGAIVQIADIINAVHNVQGVDNVRLATSGDDVINYGVQEIDELGNVVGLPIVTDFWLEDIQIPIFNNLGPLNNAPIERTQNTWLTNL